MQLQLDGRPSSFRVSNPFLIETSVSNLVPLTRPQSPDIWQNSNGGISDFRVSGQSLLKENYHNFRTSDDIDMKLGPVPKLDKRDNTTSKKLTMASCRQIVMSLSIFQSMANMEQSGNQIQETLSIKFTFSLKVTFYLTKTENRI